MKKLIPFLLFPFFVQAAEIGMGNFELCAATATYFQDGACPCDLSITAGPNVDDTTADSDVVLVGDNCSGTLHVCMDVTADSPSRADCIANTGVTDKQTSSPSGAGTETFTGASTLTGSGETQYRIWAHLVPTNYPNRPTFEAAVTATFTTNAAAGAGLTGAGLFVALADAGNTDETPTGTAGTETSGCTSMAASCSLLSHVGTPATSQNVYLAEGGVWADTTWTINWAGTSGDVVQIGCYFDDGDDDGDPVLCSSF